MCLISLGDFMKYAKTVPEFAGWFPQSVAQQQKGNNNKENGDISSVVDAKNRTKAD